MSMGMRNTTRPQESGFTLVELAVALAVVAILILVALPMFMGVRGQSQETAAQSELRDAVGPLKAHIMDGDESLAIEDGIRVYAGGIRFDAGAVAGIKLEQATDGSVCMWRVSDNGAVYGMWTSSDGGTTLYLEASALPEECPDAGNAAAGGYVSSW